MATVPRLIGPQVAATPEPSRQEPLANYGVDQGAQRAVADGLADVANVIQRERQRFDEIRVNEAEVRYRAAVDEAWLDPRKGLGQLQGSRAVEGLDPFLERLSLSMSEVESGLGSETQKALFRARGERIAADARARASAHVGTELRKQDAADFTALQQADVARIAELAQAGDTNDLAIRDTVDEAARRVALYGDRNGWSPTQTQQATLTATSQLRMVQLGTLLDAGRVDLAKLAVDEFGNELTPQDRAKVSDALQEAGERQTIVRTADGILRQLQENPVLKAEDLLAEVPLAVRPDVRKYVNGEIAARQAEAKGVYEAQFLDHVNAVEAARRRGDARPARMIVGPAEWGGLELGDRNALDRIDGGTGEAKHDDKAWLDFFLLPADKLKGLTQAEFMSKYWSRFDQPRKERALEMWKGAQQTQGRGAAGYFTQGDRVKRTFQQMFEQPVDPKEWDEEQFAAYEDAVDRAALDASATKGNKPLTDTEFRDLTVQVATRMRTQPAAAAGRGEGWGTAFKAMAGRSAWSLADQYGVPRGSVAPEKPVVPFAAIPPITRDTIVQQMRQQGRSPTEDRVSRAFTALATGDTVGYNAEVGVPLTPEAVRALRMGGFPAGFTATPNPIKRP